jgi:hypothetical protein
MYLIESISLSCSRYSPYALTVKAFPVVAAGPSASASVGKAASSGSGSTGRGLREGAADARVLRGAVERMGDGGASGTAAAAAAAMRVAGDGDGGCSCSAVKRACRVRGVWMNGGQRDRFDTETEFVEWTKKGQKTLDPHEKPKETKRKCAVH